MPRRVPLGGALLGGPHSPSPSSPQARVAAAAPRAAPEAGQGGGEAPAWVGGEKMLFIQTSAFAPSTPRENSDGHFLLFLFV